MDKQTKIKLTRQRLHRFKQMKQPEIMNMEELTTQYCKDVQFLLNQVEALEENREQLIGIAQRMNGTITTLQREKRNLIDELCARTRHNDWLKDVFGKPGQKTVTNEPPNN
jgi:DNA-directed RNA polymerase subunit F